MAPLEAEKESSPLQTEGTQPPKMPDKDQNRDLVRK